MKRILKTSASVVFALIFVLIAFASCGEKENTNEKMLYTEDTSLGNGNTQFTFIVEHIDGKKITFTVNTDKKVLSEALLENGLIDGENSSYGLYVKKVNGITQDYDTDKTYWSLYINDTASLTGVSSITVEPGQTYRFIATK